MQYTIRRIPPAVDRALRERARASRKSLNATAVEALVGGSGVAGTAQQRRDLGDIAGTWRADKAVDAALRDQDRVDQDLLAVRLALDTNGYVDLCKGLDATVALLEQADAVFLPFVVLGELRAGFAFGRRQADNERVLRRFLLKDGVSLLFADDQTTHHYASVFRQLRHQGTPIPTNDMWLAALVLQHNLVLHARDRHFNHLPQVLRA